MIYIFTALYCEASTLIRLLHLKKKPENTRFQEFCSEKSDVRLTITGVGEIAAAAAVSSICTAYPPTEDDLLINFGTCAHVSKGDGIFMCNQIFEQETGRSFYPDMLLRHSFQEASIVTGMSPWNFGQEKEAPAPLMGGALYDMEAAAVYQAGAYFFGPHQMLFLKLVSDFGSADGVSKEQVVHLMEEYKDCLSDFIERLRRMTGNREQASVRKKQEEIAKKLCLDLHCSKAMGDSLRQHLRYLALTGTDYNSVIDSLYQEGLLPCKDKREGKLRFEELKRRLF